MARKKGEDINKENDSYSSVAMKAHNKEIKLKEGIAQAMKDKDIKAAVLDYIFSGKDSTLESPLNPIREKLK